MQNLFGQTIYDPIKGDTLPLFHDPIQIDPPKPTGIDAKISRQYNDAATPFLPRRVHRGAIQHDFVDLLHEEGIAFVTIEDELKGIGIKKSSLQHFHFCVYRAEGPNWLVICREHKPGRDVMNAMIEWENVFGEGFVSIICFRKNDELVFITARDGAMEIL